MGLGGFETMDDGSQLSRVRAFVADELHTLGRTELIDDAALVASGLASNAILHAGGIAGVSVTEDGDAVRIEVHDRTRIPPVMARQSVEAMTGRGLRLVASLAKEWGAELTDEGKVVWADLSEAHTSSPFTDDGDLRRRFAARRVPRGELRRPQWSLWKRVTRSCSSPTG